MMLADSLICCGKTLPHKARSFADLPGANQADLLLSELSDAPCPFAPSRRTGRSPFMARAISAGWRAII
jgi:hypothetical protein